MSDVEIVGGKNSSLGEMFSNLSSKGIRVPDGFATTAFAFRIFLTYNNLNEPLQNLFKQINRTDYSNLDEISRQVRAITAAATMPADIAKEILQAYHELCGNTPIEVAVRSSATAEDLPNASFAGQHESYLNIKGDDALLAAVQKCFYFFVYSTRHKISRRQWFCPRKSCSISGCAKNGSLR